MQWYEKWFDANYLRLYSHRDERDARRQVRLILDTLRPAPGAAILDLACGEGRHCVLFEREGFPVSGLDLSEELIDIGRRKHPELELIVGDMRHIPSRWDVILSLFTSFGYFDSDQENEEVIASVAAALKPGGWFWLDFLNPAFVRRTLEPETVRTLEDGARVTETRRINAGRVIKDIRFEGPGGDQEYQERVRLYEPDQLREMLASRGIRPAGTFGDYAGDPWRPDSERTILYGSKP
jgi:SAM-dependent methyltransferase